MAYMILGRLGEGKPEAVMATVITSYALSSVLTGVIFLLFGLLRLGDLVSFFPRSILLGCIGGVGVFLFLTGIEVSAGLDSNMEWNLDVFKRLISPMTLVLWIVPLCLSILLMVIRHYLSHPMVMPTFFIIVVAIFYIVFAALPNVSLSDLQKHGWVFAAPEAGVPFYNFYTYYSEHYIPLTVMANADMQETEFKLVDWEAIGSTLPTMFALSFFGIIHVPINVPALGLAVQQDDVNINRELFGHGLSNAISGFVGSIQNYLVFANSRLFIQNGGNSRAAGVLLAFATAAVWVAGPAMIGYIPILVVGTLIFMLGIEMVQEALWDTFGRLHRLEYLMVLAITLVMGFHDFVVGIVLGIVLACLIFVVQTSRVSAIRATYSGIIAESTVRRHPVQRRFLHAVGSQINVTKLSGYLFFGTIVAVERNIKGMIDEEAFIRQPIRYLILDFDHVAGMDFSAAEAFVRMNRILRSKGVEMVLAGIPLSGDIGKSLAMVGLLEEDEDENAPPPRLFETLNQALEACENELLIAFKKRSENISQHKATDTLSMAIPRMGSPGAGVDMMFGSPRRHHVEQAAVATLKESETAVAPKWQNFAQPLPLIMQTFKDLTDKDIDFWHRVSPYFQRKEYTAGSVLYSRGDEPDGFYILEEGILRADYDLEQGKFYESIVAGTTCGELPFFSDSERTGTVVAETHCVVWLLTKEKWREIEAKLPDVATELLKIGLKLTSERMNTITS
jgi:SulP family sulfate permease